MKPLRILVVDDHAVLRRGMHALLAAQQGWEVCGEAKNGQEALRLALELQPDIVIMDVAMPELNGVEATRKIRQALPNTEVLIFTLHNLHDILEAARAAGARAFVCKSDAERDLLEAVRALGARQPFHSATFAAKDGSAFAPPEPQKAKDTRGGTRPPGRHLRRIPQDS